MTPDTTGIPAGVKYAKTGQVMHAYSVSEKWLYAHRVELGATPINGSRNAELRWPVDELERWFETQGAVAADERERIHGVRRPRSIRRTRRSREQAAPTHTRAGAPLVEFG